jgi:GNAT superfamily N-acetyltransferase
VIRPGRPSDANFVKSSFFESSKDSAVARSVSPALYRRRWAPLIDRLVARHALTVFADDESPDVILGWALYSEPNLLVYVFVREDFRRQGIARALLARLSRSSTYAFRTTAWQQASPRLAPSMSYDPTLAWAHFQEKAA